MSCKPNLAILTLNALQQHKSELCIRKWASYWIAQPHIEQAQHSY